MYNSFYSDSRRQAIKSLDKDKYPALYKMLFVFWRDKLFRTLEYYWRVQDTKEGQHLNPTSGHYEFTESRQHSAKNARYISSDPRVWQRNTILLHCLGLITIRRAKPRKPGEYTPEFDYWTILNMVNKKQQQPITIITTQSWTLDMLDYSEAQAQKWVDNRTSAKYLTKETIINIFGQELADQAYSDDRGIPESTDKAIESIQKAIVKTSKARGYTTKAKVFAQVQKSIGKIKTEKTWSEYGKRILAEIGYWHHRPTKTDKAKYGIKSDNNKWIITPLQVDMLEGDKGNK